jgi:hypothetical protein
VQPPTRPTAAAQHEEYETDGAAGEEDGGEEEEEDEAPDWEVFGDHVADIERARDSLGELLDDLKRMLEHKNIGGCPIDRIQTPHMREFAYARNPLTEISMELGRAATRLENYLQSTNVC